MYFWFWKICIFCWNFQYFHKFFIFQNSKFSNFRVFKFWLKNVYLFYLFICLYKMLPTFRFVVVVIILKIKTIWWGILSTISLVMSTKAYSWHNLMNFHLTLAVHDCMGVPEMIVWLVPGHVPKSGILGNFENRPDKIGRRFCVRGSFPSR